MNARNLTTDEKNTQRQIHLNYDFPKVFSISLGVYRCNLSCRMCPMHNEPPSKQDTIFMSREVLERCNEAVGNRDCNYEISAWGETYQHPEADDFIDLIRKQCPNTYMVVATNGTLLTPKRCERIVDSGLNYLSFSIDANSPETYKWLTGSDMYDKVARNLETLVETRAKKNAKHLKITAHIIGIKELSHEFDAFKKRWEGIVDRAIVRPYGNWAGMVDNNGVSPAQTQHIPAERYPCSWLWHATKVEPNGDVSKCFVHVTGDKDPLGNVLQDSFENIWRNDKMKAVRELHLEGRHDEVEHCKTCIVWSLFPNFWERKTGPDGQPLGWK